MAFFDNIGKKATEATAKAVQKAQELSEISRINSLISEEEKKISTTYCQIGKLYVSAHASDSEEGFSEMVATVLEGEQKINDYRKQIQNLKCVQRCEKCGAEVAKGVTFCSSCGAPIPKVEETLPDDAVRCDSCGAIVKRGMRFCTACGKPMTLSAQVGALPEDQTTESLCPHCGAKVDKNTAFCTECGEKI